MSDCLAPIQIDRLLDDPSVIRDLTERNAPYFPVQRYVHSDAEHRAISAQGPMLVAPNFRGDWAYDRPLIEGAELFLNNRSLIEAAERLFDTDLVRPHQVYSNLTWQLPFPQGKGHTDVPAFRGVDRTRYPIWFLHVMGRSGLFEDERIRIATAVAWFYEGEDGGFEYWPDGPDRPPRTHQGEIFNTAIVGDNDRMFHRVMPVGRVEDGMINGMSLETRLEHVDGDRWSIVEKDTLAAPTWPAIRISVSWKAMVFRDEAEQRMVDEHTCDITAEDALQRFYDDLDRRGIECERPADPLRDPAFVETLSTTYVRDPSVFA
jgi:hypothetical protein